MTGEPGLRLLVVDDDEIDRERVRRALRSMVPSPRIAECDNIVAAERELSQHTFDCVVLDYQLREGPCIAFLPTLQTRAPHAAFVVLTGQGDETVAVELMKAGAADYLSKDVEPERVRQAIKYAISLRRAADHAAAAEARRSQYAERLGRFVDRAPELIAARSLDDLARVGAAIAADVFEAKETLLVLRDNEQSATGQRGADHDDEALRTWATAALSAGNDLVSEGAQTAIGLRGRDGVDRGLIALRDGTPALDHLLRQLAVMIAMCTESLVLYDAKSRAIRARDDVMAVVSHDLRAPLNNVRLGTSLLRETTESAAHPVLDRVERNVTHMAHLVDDLVDMVRLESGQLHVTLGRESVDDLIHTAASLVADQARDQRIELVLHPTDGDLAVAADRDRVLQVLSNLLSNALKFTPVGGTIQLRAEERAGRIRFGVEDSGCGIPASESSRIFMRFWQSDPKRRRGLGLGLHIAKGVIQAHGGDLWFESHEGAGTRFYFTLAKATSRAHASADEAGVGDVLRHV